MRKEEARHRREVEACFEEADAIERQEDEQYGDTRMEELPEHLRTTEKRRQAIQLTIRKPEESKRKAPEQQAQRRAKAEGCSPLAGHAHDLLGSDSSSSGAARLKS